MTRPRHAHSLALRTPDGTDQWSKHRIVTKLEIWFPKDLRRDPVTNDTGGVRDWRRVRRYGGGLALRGRQGGCRTQTPGEGGARRGRQGYAA